MLRPSLPAVTLGQPFRRVVDFDYAPTAALALTSRFSGVQLFTAGFKVWGIDLKFWGD